MYPKPKPPLSPLIILLLAAFVALGNKMQGADPVLRFPEDYRWKAIFDIGFRPKHVSGLERRTCEIVDQSFQVQLKGQSDLFPLDRGLLTFDLRSDDSIRMIWHQSRVPVSMEEGRRRLELFEKLVAGHITQKGRMPVVVDKATASVNTGSEFESIALIDGHFISYGFNSSFVKEAPLIPHFYLSVQEPVVGGLPPREKTVTPPKGYEWYSLDPKIDTPAPGISRPMSAVEKPTATEQPRPAKRSAPTASEAADPPGFNPVWFIVAVGVVLILVALVVIRRLGGAKS